MFGTLVLLVVVIIILGLFFFIMDKILPPLTDGQNKLNSLVVSCWDSELLTQRLISEPHAVFAEYGIDVPEGVIVKVEFGFFRSCGPAASIKLSHPDPETIDTTLLGTYDGT